MRSKVSSFMIVMSDSFERLSKFKMEAFEEAFVLHWSCTEIDDDKK